MQTAVRRPAMENSWNFCSTSTFVAGTGGGVWAGVGGSGAVMMGAMGRSLDAGCHGLPL